MTKLYTYDKWVEEFQPMPNHLRNQDNGLELAYETYGEEVEYVNLQDEKFVWTEVDGDEGTYILAGWHFVNRIQYYITNRPWEDEWTEVPTWVYRSCDCDNEGDYDPNCPECDEGTIDIPCDTVEALKQIYGEDADIVG
jgi:hypothetical protein